MQINEQMSIIFYEINCLWLEIENMFTKVNLALRT
jgi:hypothetical protein